MMNLTERQMWEFELAAARERMLNTKGKRISSSGPGDPEMLTNNLYTTAKKIGDGQQKVDIV